MPVYNTDAAEQQAPTDADRDLVDVLEHDTDETDTADDWQDGYRWALGPERPELTRHTRAAAGSRD